MFQLLGVLTLVPHRELCATRTSGRARARTRERKGEGRRGNGEGERARESERARERGGRTCPDEIRLALADVGVALS